MKAKRPDFDREDLEALIPFVALEVAEAEKDGANDEDRVLFRFSRRLRAMFLSHPRCTESVRKKFDEQLKKKRREVGS
jgi:hypothetical protein